MRSIIKDKKGDFASIIYVTIFLLVIGVIVFFVVDLNYELFFEIESALNNSDYGTSEAFDQAIEFKNTNASRIWDYAFLGIFFGSLIALGLTAFAIRISPAFYWIYGIMAIMVLALGTILSNFWQDLAVEPEFANTLVNFPIMNSLLGSYYPLIVTAIIILAMVVLFGKPRGGEVNI